MRSLWSATAAPGPSLEQLGGDVRAQVAIIGAGYTGLSAALYLACAGSDVVVLEAVDVGDRASGLNGGQVIPGVKHDPDTLEEIFGPTTAIIPVDSLDEALAAANSTQFGLSLSIYTNDLRHAFRAIHELESGIVYVNAPTIGAEIQLPFGGTKNTGNGHREAGGHVLDEFSEWKSIYIDYSGRLQRAQIDTDAP